MRDLYEVAKECMSELSAIGVIYGNVAKWEVNTRAKHRWGQCRYNMDGTYTININSNLLDERSSIDGLKNTIIHELLHTVKGCDSHNSEWHKWASYVNRKLGYNIKRVSTADEKGIADEIISNELSKAKYIIECPICHYQWTRDRMTKIVKNPSHFRCIPCNAKLVRIK